MNKLFFPFVIVMAQTYGQEVDSKSTLTSLIDSVGYSTKNSSGTVSRSNGSSFSLLVSYNRLTQELDSLRTIPMLPVSTDSVPGATLKRIDTVLNFPGDADLQHTAINFIEDITIYSTRLDTLMVKLTAEIDSVAHLSKYDSLDLTNLFGIQNRTGDVDKLVLPEAIQPELDWLDTLEQKVFQRLDSIEGKARQKLMRFLQDGDSGLDSFKLNEANLELTHGNDLAEDGFPEWTGSYKNLMPDTDLSENLDIPDAGLDVRSSGIAPGLPDINLKRIEVFQDVSKVQDKLSVVNETGEQINGYNRDLTNLREGGVENLEKMPEVIESSVEGLEGIESLKKSSEEFAAIKAKWNDPEVVKEKALNKAKEGAVNHFAGHEEKLESAMAKLSKLKSKIPDPEGALDLFSSRQRFLKEKKLFERFVPGLAMQFQKQESYWVDLNPYLGFKIMGRWLFGAGWNERVAYTFDNRDWDRENRIYGLRNFLHFRLKEKLWLKSEAEYMNAPIRALPMMASEVVGRKWVWSFFAGLKKDIEISKRFTATLQTLYNIYNPDKRSPYAHRVNIRVGFELPVRMKRR